MPGRVDTTCADYHHFPVENLLELALSSGFCKGFLRQETWQKCGGGHGAHREPDQVPTRDAFCWRSMLKPHVLTPLSPWLPSICSVVRDAIRVSHLLSSSGRAGRGPCPASA